MCSVRNVSQKPYGPIQIQKIPKYWNAFNACRIVFPNGPNTQRKDTKTIQMKTHTQTLARTYRHKWSTFEIRWTRIFAASTLSLSVCEVHFSYTVLRVFRFAENKTSEPAGWKLCILLEKQQYIHIHVAPNSKLSTLPSTCNSSSNSFTKQHAFVCDFQFYVCWVCECECVYVCRKHVAPHWRDINCLLVAAWVCLIVLSFSHFNVSTVVVVGVVVVVVASVAVVVVVVVVHAFPPLIRLAHSRSVCQPTIQHWLVAHEIQSVVYNCRLSTYIHLLLSQNISK